MSISINDSMYSSYLDQTAQSAKASASAGAVQDSVGGVNENSTEAEMKQAIKDFESYFVEQILKNVRESLKSDEDSSYSQMTDYFMSTVGEQLADKIVDQVGDRLTQTLYEQMCRNYSIPQASGTEDAAGAPDVEADTAEAAAIAATGAVETEK